MTVYIILQHNCCGVNNASDWTGKREDNDDGVPDSCCEFEATGCGKDETTPKYTKVLKIRWCTCIYFVQATML